jgi:hypothetical protein
MRIVEVDGIKLEIDERTARTIESYKVGDPVKVLVKSYGDSYNIYPGVRGEREGSVMKLDLCNVLEAAQAHAERGERVLVKVLYFERKDRDDARALTLDAGLPNGSEWTAGRPCDDDESTADIRWLGLATKDTSGAQVEVTAFWREASDV